MIEHYYQVIEFDMILLERYIFGLHLISSDDDFNLLIEIILDMKTTNAYLKLCVSVLSERND